MAQSVIRVREMGKCGYSAVLWLGIWRLLWGDFGGILFSGSGRAGDASTSLGMKKSFALRGVKRRFFGFFG